MPGVSPAKASGHEGGLPPVRLRRVLDHIEAHLGDDIAMDRLAEVARLSPDHFSRLFRQSMGLRRPVVLYREIARARQLVRQPTVAGRNRLRVSSPSQAHFTTMFALDGTTPGTYRGMTSHGDRRSPAIAM